jgi:hypothetical protein
MATRTSRPVPASPGAAAVLVTFHEFDAVR